VCPGPGPLSDLQNWECRCARWAFAQTGADGRGGGGFYFLQVYMHDSLPVLFPFFFGERVRFALLPRLMCADLTADAAKAGPAHSAVTLTQFASLFLPKSQPNMCPVSGLVYGALIVDVAEPQRARRVRDLAAAEQQERDVHVLGGLRRARLQVGGPQSVGARSIHSANPFR
jgi:hypothetical protein